MRKHPTISLIGAGRVGSGLALALAAKGYRIAGVMDTDAGRARALASRTGAKAVSNDSTDAIFGAGLVIIAVPDDLIAAAVHAVAAGRTAVKGQIYCHTSGYLSSRVFAPLARDGVHAMSLHPLFSVPRSMSPASFAAGSSYTLEGDPVALRAGLTLVRALRGRAAIIRAGDKPAYHAACVMATNYVTVLMRQSEKLFHAAGYRENTGALLSRLLNDAAIAMEKGDLNKKLTGPAVRGDAGTVRGELQLLRRKDPVAAMVYRALGLAAVEMGEQSGLEQKKAAMVRRALR